MPNVRKDYSGQKFGKLTAISYHDAVRSGRSGHVCSRWLCQCDCGNRIIVRSSRFSTEACKRVLSCGCKPHGNRKFSREESTYRQQHNYHKKDCKKKGWQPLPFEIWKRYVKQPCTTCGYQGDERDSQSGSTIRINGIDRIDSSKPYFIDNIQTMCNFCNIAKGPHSTEFLIQRCKQVATYNPDIQELREWKPH